MVRISAKDLIEIGNIGPNGRLVLLKAYLDESRHSDGPVCVVAGWAGNSENWQAFEAEWLNALKPRRALHMNDLRWNTKPQRLKALLDKMAPIPARHGLMRVASSMRHRDYMDLAFGTVAELSLKPYLACVMGCLKSMLDGMSPTQELHVYFERQDTYESIVEVLSKSVFEDRRVRGMTYLQKDSSVCFQPADYLAFHLSNRAIDKDGHKATLTRPINGPGMGWAWSRAQIKRHVEAATKELNASRRALIRFGASRKKR